MPAASNLDKGWQSLNGFDSPWPQTSVAQAAASRGPLCAPRPRTPKNGHFPAPPGFEATVKTCKSCDEAQKAVARCNECAEDLCEACVSAHQRVKLTKDHLITWLDKAVKPPALAVTAASMASATASIAQMAVSSPLPVSTEAVTSVQSTSPFEGAAGGVLVNRGVVGHEVMQVYQGAVEKAKSESKSLISKANLGMTQIEEAKGNVRDMKARVDLQYNTVKQDVTGTIRQYIGALQEREAILLKRLDTIR